MIKRTFLALTAALIALVLMHTLGSTPMTAPRHHVVTQVR